VLDWTIFVLCVVLSLSMSILLLYLADFIKFVKEKREEERIQTLNETVDRILQYKNVDMNNIVIELKDTDYKTHYDNVYDISDYNDLRPMVPHEVNDAYIDDLAARELVYSHNMRMWIPKDEKKR